MLTVAKTLINFDFDKWDRITWKDHDDYDLKNCVDAISLKSLDGSVHSFYREGNIENPEDYKHTAYYKLFKPLVDFFEVKTTRVRIHRQLPGKKTKLHTDDNNVGIKDASEYNLRLLTALTESENFIYQFKSSGKLDQMSLKKGQSVIFDPDIVAHGMVNFSKTETRYSLIQVFKAYPVTPWLKKFINTEQIIKL
jgi:hypothetical protein